LVWKKLKAPTLKRVKSSGSEKEGLKAPALKRLGDHNSQKTPLFDL